MINPLRFEEWREITDRSVPGVKEGAYLVSNFGRVYSCLSECFLSLVITSNGYYRVNLRNEDGSARYHLIHRIVMIEFHYIPNHIDMQVNHEDGDKSNNFDTNLTWSTPSENIIHAYRTGLKVKEHGEDCSYATITNAQARQIAQLITEQIYTHKEIADIVGCSAHIVHNISNGSNWKFVYDEYELEKYKKSVNKLSDSDLHLLCKYFEDNYLLYDNKTDLYRNALSDLFGVEYTQSMSASMSRYFNHKTRKDITDKYNF